MRASLGFKLAVCLALCTVSLQNQSLHLAAAAQSSDVDFSQGLSFYKSQNYAGARTCFERAQKKYHQSWQIQLYIAHCYMAQGKSLTAKQCYESARNMSKDPACQSACNDALARLGASSTASSSRSSSNSNSNFGSSSSGPGLSGSSPSSGPNLGSAADRIAKEDSDRGNEQRQRIKAQLAQDIARIREEGKQQIEAEQASSKTFYRNANTGEVKKDISDEREMEIRKDTEERVKEAQRIAEQRLKFVK